MSEALKKLITEKQEAFRADPSEAQETFVSESGLKDGFCSEVSIREHGLTVDEPEGLLDGTNKGPNPVELVLAALGTCQEITYRAYAAAMGIPVDSISVTVEGDIDLRGFFAVDEGVRPGYQAIKGTVHIVSSASEEEIKQLRHAVNAHCPVLDIISDPVPVDLKVDLKAPSAAAAQ